MPMIFRRRISALNLILAAVLVALAGTGSWLLWGPDGAAADAATTTTKVTSTDVTATVTASGTAAAKTVRDVTFESEGTVDDIEVKVGDTVKKGDTLATASSPGSGTKVASAQASYNAAQANYSAVVKKTKKASATDKNQQRTSAYAQVEQARLSLVEAQNAYAGLTLKSPINGTVTAVNGTEGGSTTVSGSDGASSGFITISNLSKFVVTGSFSEADVSKVKVGDTASITFNAVAGQTFTGKVSAIDLTATSTDGVTSYGVTISIDKPPSNLRDGATATVTVTTAKAEGVIAVPASAVTTSNGVSTVKVVKNGKSKATTVTIGVEGDTYTEIKSGLKVGDTIELGAVSSSSGNGSRFPGGTFPGGGVQGGGPVIRMEGPSMSSGKG
ncbi:HlyD family efflux transporter periplasmic adaptor subunit [Aeromicrobium panaciterrae]|uniref:efflux RND transporter periplasmic adaptor subunit n=1 Tax=Aeromicrobium panaciterrae TaxID=363861 RepID=UPI0031D50989